MGGVGQNHVQIDFRLCQGAQNPGRIADFVRNAGDGEAGLVAVDGDAADDDGFHGGSFFLHDGTGVIVHGVANFKDDAEFFGEFHGARLHHLGTAGCHFQHFVVGKGLYLPGVLHHAGVAGVHAVHIRKNLAHGTGRAAAAQRLDHAFLRHALEAGADEDVAFHQAFVHPFRVNFVDAAAGVGAEGGNARLGSREGHGLVSQFMQGHAEQGDGLLFPGSHQDVQLAFGGGGGQFPGQADQHGCGAPHCGCGQWCPRRSLRIFER